MQCNEINPFQDPSIFDNDLYGIHGEWNSLINLLDWLKSSVLSQFEWIYSLFLQNVRNGAFLHVDLAHKVWYSHVVFILCRNIFLQISSGYLSRTVFWCEFEREQFHDSFFVFPTGWCEDRKIVRILGEKIRCSHDEKSEKYKHWGSIRLSLHYQALPQRLSIIESWYFAWFAQYSLWDRSPMKKNLN